jgi:hypothetical protein
VPAEHIAGPPETFAERLITLIAEITDSNGSRSDESGRARTCLRDRSTLLRSARPG